MSSATPAAIDYKALVQDDRIHASLYSDPRIFADEMDRIFRAGWVFVGHASEIPHPGDYVTRTLGREPVIMVRGSDGGIVVLVIGEVGLFAPDGRRTATVVCETDVEIGSVSDAKLLELYVPEPAFGLHLMRLVVQRMLVGERHRTVGDHVYSG